VPPPVPLRMSRRTVRDTASIFRSDISRGAALRASNA
jgi:hypothetical protein